jgi:hypothetical protein
MIDQRLPFGASRSPEISNKITQAIHEIMVYKGFKTIPANMHIWDPYGLYLGKPIWVCPYWTNITALYGKTIFCLFISLEL